MRMINIKEVGIDMKYIDEESANALVKCGLLKKVISDEALTDGDKAVLYWQQLVDGVSKEVRRDGRKVRNVTPAVKEIVKDKPLGL